MRIRDAQDFGAIARQRRRDIGMSQEALAQRAGVTRQWLVRFEKGNSDVSLSKAFAVLGELGLVVRADPASSPSVSHTSFAIPKIEIPELHMDALRRSLDQKRDVPTEQVLASMRDAIERLNRD